MRRENRVVNTVYIIISLSTNNDYSIHSLMIPVLCIPAFQTLILSYFLCFSFHLFYHYIFITFLYFFLFLCFQFVCSKQARIIVWMLDRCMQHVQQIANDADLIYIAAFNCANKGPGAND